MPSTPRFENTVILQCNCGSDDPAKRGPVVMQCLGNFSLRGAAGAKQTRIGYACPRCHRRLMLVDEIPSPDAAALIAMDTTE